MKGFSRWNYALLGFCVLAAAGCAHKAETTASNKAAGYCPTEVHHANVAVVEGDKSIDVRIMTRPGGDALAIQNRAEEIAEALVQMHPARPPGAEEPIQHVAVRDVRISSIPEGAVLTFEAEDDTRLALLRDRIDDHVMRWRRGDCPILTDESVRPEETKNWQRNDR